MAQAVPQRSDVPVEHTWDAASVFPSDEAWEAEIERFTEMIGQLESFRGHLGDSAAALADWLQAFERLMYSVSQIYLYAGMFHEVNIADQAAAAKYDRAIGLFARAQSAGAFAEPEMLAIGFDTLRDWARVEPRLVVYSHYFDQLERRQDHVRSVEVEELLGQVADPFFSTTRIHSILADADLRFQPARDAAGETLEVAQGTIFALLAHPDREVRRTAWENYADAHLETKNTMAICLATGIKQDVFVARARRYPSALEAALTANHIPVAVFHNLLETYRRHLPTWHRYWNVRRRALGYDTLHVYDIRAPLTQRMPVVPFEQAIEWISAGMRSLGEEYVRIMRRGTNEQRWVDKYPNHGKRMGAFSSGVPGTHPFILMSYTNDLFSMSTLAHELGHSMHSYYTWQTQPLIYTDYSLFVAEVASNFNQVLVRAHLLNEYTDPDFQIALIEEAMANFHRYFFIMPTLARFELEIHQRVERGEALTAENMNQLMTDLFREGYGDEVAIDPERIGITWAQFSTHLYANFYVYQYATGISAAHALGDAVLKGVPGAVQNYLGFLKAGASSYPLDILRRAGVDMTSPEPVEQTFGVLADLVERLDRLIPQRSPTMA